MIVFSVFVHQFLFFLIFSHNPEIPALFFFFFFFIQLPPSTLLSLPWLPLMFPLCAPVGNSAFPVILLVGRFSVDFAQTVGSALREGLVLDLQSLLIILSSFKQPSDNGLAPVRNPSHP